MSPTTHSAPEAAPRPPRSGPRAERAFAVNVLGTLSLTLADRVMQGSAAAARHGANAPAALVTVLWYPDRPIAFLADRLRITHPGAVQLVDRLERDGLIERVPALDGRTKLLALTPAGERVALDVLSARRDVLDRAVAALDDAQVRALSDAVAVMLEALTDDLLTSEHMCRLCDELACPDSRCPVERAEPAPGHRRGTGYGVT
jgi:MarR family transcriptional regulator, negative regulator of the multidrug operon emrRAB